MKRLLAACLLGSVFCLAHLSDAQVTEQTNFDDVADGAIINTHYSSLVVTFDCTLGTDPLHNLCLNTNSQGFGGTVYVRTPTEFVSSACNGQGGLVATPSLAHSPNNVVTIVQPNNCPAAGPANFNQTFFNESNGYVNARFPVAASSVSIWANVIFPDLPDCLICSTTNLPYLEAYDSNGNLLATAQYSTTELSSSLGWVQLTITPYMVNHKPISRVRFSSPVPIGAVLFTSGQFDDLTFTLPSATVPAVVGMTLPNAEASITAANLTVGAVSQQPSSTVPEGDVISQNPIAGAVVVQGTAVNLWESCGAPVKVPYVGYLPIATAESRIVAAGLNVGTFTYQRSTIPIGEVISTNPPGFSAVCPNTTINGVISSGQNPPPIP